MVRYTLGDAPTAIDRQIEDGSIYDKYFPPVNGSVRLLKKNGDVDDTVKLMAQMERDFCYQTEQIAKVLAVYTNGKIDAKKTAENVWNFVVKYIKYNIEQGEQLQTPAHTWYQAQILARKHPENGANSADCDCMSIFCGCIFRNLGIKHSFRIAGYANSLGITRGYQHVYVIVHDNRRNVICDPVYTKFNAEKETAMEKDYSMALSGTDIYCLSGTPGLAYAGESSIGLTYVEQPDGSLGLLNGRAKRKKRKAERKAKKKARKQARKDKRAAKKELRSARKELRKARRSGDKDAIAKAKAKKEAAKQKKQEAKERIDANRTGIAKVVSKVGKFVKNTALALPRASFLLLLRLNFRGLARKFSNNQKAYDKFCRIWKQLGGKTKKLQKAIDKGKGKKALFGSKKNQNTPLTTELDGLGTTLAAYGIIPHDAFAGFGKLGVEPVTTSVGAAIASAAPIIRKVLSVMQEVGEFIPNSADESTEEATEDIEASDTNQIDNEEYPDEDDGYIEPDFSKNEAEDIAEADEPTEEEDYSGEDEESTEEMSGCNISGDGCYYVDDVMELNGTLGKGLFKKVFGGAKKLVSKVKEKRAAKKASKSSGSQKGGLLSRLKAKRASKKAAKADKKATRKAAKAERKATRQAKRSERSQQTSAQTEQESGKSTLFSKVKNKVNNTIRKASDSKALQTAMRYSTGLNKGKQEEIITMDKSSNTMQPTTAKESWAKRNKTVLIVGGSALVLLTLGLVFKDKIFGGGSVNGYDPIELE